MKFMRLFGQRRFLYWECLEIKISQVAEELKDSFFLTNFFFS